MADTAELVRFASTIEGLNVAVLVPNLRGAENAIAAGARKMSIPFSMSETHSLKNVHKDHAAMLDEIRAIAALVADRPVETRPHFEVGLATAFGCTMEGPVEDDVIVALAEASMEAGAVEVGLSDTTGYANPAQVKRLVRRVKAAVGADKLNTLHLHNTRGLGLANALAGWRRGSLPSILRLAALAVVRSLPAPRAISSRRISSSCSRRWGSRRVSISRSS
jgi:hydroxymethylglutaryl-CoA lyase